MFFPCLPTGLCFLVRLCTDMGLKEVQDYATKLKKVENMKEIRDQVLYLLTTLLSKATDSDTTPFEATVDFGFTVSFLWKTDRE